VPMPGGEILDQRLRAIGGAVITDPKRPVLMLLGRDAGQLCGQPARAIQGAHRNQDGGLAQRLAHGLAASVLSVVRPCYPYPGQRVNRVQKHWCMDTRRASGYIEGYRNGS
jgi:hypothetical protein